MKILQVNKFLYPKGGAETYVLKLGKILEDHGEKEIGKEEKGGPMNLQLGILR